MAATVALAAAVVRASKKKLRNTRFLQRAPVAGLTKLFSRGGAAGVNLDAEPSGTKRTWTEVKATILGKTKGMSRLMEAKPVRNAMLVVSAFVVFTVAGLLANSGAGEAVQHAVAHAGDGHGHHDAVPVLREGASAFCAMIKRGIDSVSANEHAFPNSVNMLGLLGSIALGLPLLARLGLSSSVLANLALGTILGPSCFNLFQDHGVSNSLAHVGVLFFLCEMGLEITVERLKKLWREIFVVGLLQFTLASGVFYAIARYMLVLGRFQSLVIGVAFSLSSTAFVLQLLGEAKERGTRHGRVAYGMLLMQDLMVPLLLVWLPMLQSAGGAAVCLGAFKQAMVRTFIALSLAGGAGRLGLTKLFSFVASCGSPAALRCLTFFALFGLCYLFEAFGLPGSLGAFLAGVLLSETAYRQQVDLVLAPLRQDFFGLFFMTVGFSVDLQLVFTHPFLMFSMLSGILLTKTLVTILVCRLAGLRLANAQQIGLLLSQAGEFSFVILTIARSMGALSELQSNWLITVCGVSLAITPILANTGRDLAIHMDQRDTSKATMELPKKTLYGGIDQARAEVVIFGYGRVGRMISQVLDRTLVKWAAWDGDPRTVNDARRKDLPVYYGDVNQFVKAFEIPGAENKGLSDVLAGAKMVILTLGGPAAKSTVKACEMLMERNPGLSVMARVKNMDEATRLAGTGAMPLIPTLPEDSMVLNLPVGGAVLEELGYSKDEVETIVREKRLKFMREEESYRQQLVDMAARDTQEPLDT